MKLYLKNINYFLLSLAVICSFSPTLSPMDEQLNNQQEQSPISNRQNQNRQNPLIFSPPPQLPQMELSEQDQAFFNSIPTTIPNIKQQTPDHYKTPIYYPKYYVPQTNPQTQINNFNTFQFNTFNTTFPPTQQFSGKKRKRRTSTNTTTNNHICKKRKHVLTEDSTYKPSDSSISQSYPQSYPTPFDISNHFQNLYQYLKINDPIGAMDTLKKIPHQFLVDNFSMSQDYHTSTIIKLALKKLNHSNPETIPYLTISDYIINALIIHYRSTIKYNENEQHIQTLETPLNSLDPNTPIKKYIKNFKNEAGIKRLDDDAVKNIEAILDWYYITQPPLLFSEDSQL